MNPFPDRYICIPSQIFFFNEAHSRSRQTLKIRALLSVHPYPCLHTPHRASSRIRKMRRFTSSCKCAKSHPGGYSQCKHCTVSNDSDADSEGSDQTARMCKLIWAFAIRICQTTRFRMARPNHSQLTYLSYIYSIHIPLLGGYFTIPVLLCSVALSYQIMATLTSGD